MKKNTDKRRGLTKKQRRKKKLIQAMNRRLIKKYYFVMPRNVWYGTIPIDYDYTWINWGWGYGWDKTFGWMYLKELGDAVLESGQKDFMILEQKEKYGSARNYTSGTSQKVLDIIDKYEYISEHICYYCGVEAPMVDTGWVTPQCFRCFCKAYKRNEQWYLKHHPEMKPKTDEELRELYNKDIVDTPDENGEYHIPMSYTIKRHTKDTEEEITYDISDTVKKIQKRISNYK